MIRIVTDSSADIPTQYAEGFDITVIPLQVTFGQETYREGINITHDEFYKRLIRDPSNLPTTSVPPLSEFKQLYQEILDEGDEIISIHLSSSLAGAYNAAALAAQQLDPSRITVIDSRSVSMCLGWVVIKAAEMALRYESKEHIIAQIKDMLPRLRIPSFLDTLDYIKIGGRLGAASAFFGSTLNVKPIVHLSDGVVAPLAVVRSRQKAMNWLVQLAKRMAPFDDLAVMHTHAPQLADQLAKKLAPISPSRRLLITETGIAMGTHTGPNSLGICAVVSPR
ncbi:MAG: DegV family protein [Ardenticatenaceae bacterium]